MTVSSVLPIKYHTYTGAGVYGVTYPVLDGATIFVKLSLNTGDIADLMAVTDFTVEILPEDGGAEITVLTTDYDSTGVSLEIRRILTIEQTTEWDNGSALDMPLLTQSFDKVIMLMQQISTDLSSYTAKTNWRGLWAANQYYTLNNIVEAANGSWYVAIIEHISNGFDSDLVAGKWFLVLDIVHIEQLTAQSAQSASESSVSAATALVSELAAAASKSACDADVVLTHADVVLTHADAAATAINKAAAAASAATAANLVIQGERVDAISTDSYATTLGQVEFTVTKPAPVANIVVFLNSRKLKLTEDYTVDDALVVGLVTLTSSAGVGDELDILSFNTIGVSSPAKINAALLYSNSLLQGSSITSNYISPNFYKTFNVGAGKLFVSGMLVTVLRSVAPTTHWMKGTVISYNGTTGVIVISMSSCLGSGTYTGWYIVSDSLISPVFYGMLQVTGYAVPASATATGTKGQIVWDADYIYVCTATNTWKRTQLATW